MWHSCNILSITHFGCRKGNIVRQVLLFFAFLDLDQHFLQFKPKNEQTCNHYILLNIILLSYLYGYLAYIYVPCACMISSEIIRGCQISWDWYYRQLLDVMWVLRVEFEISARTANALTYQLCIAQKGIFNYKMHD